MREHFLTVPMSRRSGFTLIEMMVVATILAVIIATALPAVGKNMAATRVQRAGSVVATDIQRAFTLAAQRRSPVRISIDTAGKTFRIMNRARDTTFLTTTYNSTSDLVVTRLGASDTTIVIYPNGLAQAALTVTVYSPSHARQVAATRAGQIRTTVPSGYK